MNANGCCAVQTPHRSTRLPVNGESFVKSETFAIDWVQLRDGALFDGDGTRNEDWYCYGAELLAVADGRVIYVRDDMLDEAPMQPPVAVKNSRDFGGNQVIIEIEPGVYAFYGHLKPGSVAVAVGDHVAAGQVIGLLGNSGNSTGPHLHFGLLDGPNPLAATSLPMVIDAYILEGMIVEPAEAPDAGVPTVGAGRPCAAAIRYVAAVSVGRRLRRARRLGCVSEASNMTPIRARRRMGVASLDAPAGPVISTVKRFVGHALRGPFILPPEGARG